MASLTGGPAFPNGYGSPKATNGMSLRDYFAGQAVNRLAGMYDVDEITDPDLPRAFARAAYLIADAMLAEREKE